MRRLLPDAYAREQDTYRVGARPRSRNDAKSKAFREEARQVLVPGRAYYVRSGMSQPPPNGRERLFASCATEADAIKEKTSA